VDIDTALKEAMAIEGATGVALVDWESGMALGTLGGGRYLDLDLDDLQIDLHDERVVVEVVEVLEIDLAVEVIPTEVGVAV